MAEPKTTPTPASVDEFLATAPENRRADAAAAVALLRDVTGAEPTMWGPSIVGFGSYHYRYASGREGDAPQIGLSPRKAALTFYGLQDGPGAAELLERLGPHTLGAGCVYVKALDRLDDAVLRELAVLAWTVDRQALLDAPRD